MTVPPLRLRPDVHFREIDGQVIVLDADQGLYLSVNPSGSVLWPLLAEGTDEDRLTERLVARYGLPLEQARADVAAWVAWLEAHRLLAPRAPS